MRRHAGLAAPDETDSRHTVNGQRRKAFPRGLITTLWPSRSLRQKQPQTRRLQRRARAPPEHRPVSLGTRVVGIHPALGKTSFTKTCSQDTKDAPFWTQEISVIS